MAQVAQSRLGFKAEQAAMDLPARPGRQVRSAESVAVGRALTHTRDHAVENTNELQQAPFNLNVLKMPLG